ncbi:hypothetical protein K0B04_00320 [Patescibacteria group bacterium]|nr:hypothetical protein [Patescibacteria group bacterium]
MENLEIQTPANEEKLVRVEPVKDENGNEIGLPYTVDGNRIFDVPIRNINNSEGDFLVPYTPEHLTYTLEQIRGKFPTKELEEEWVASLIEAYNRSVESYHSPILKNGSIIFSQGYYYNPDGSTQYGGEALSHTLIYQPLPGEFHAFNVSGTLGLKVRRLFEQGLLTKDVIDFFINQPNSEIRTMGLHELCHKLGTEYHDGTLSMEFPYENNVNEIEKKFKLQSNHTVHIEILKTIKDALRKSGRIQKESDPEIEASYKKI